MYNSKMSFWLLTILKINNDDREIFDVWWNYHAPNGPSLFDKMSKQDTIIFHLCDDQGTRSSLAAPNEFKNFSNTLLRFSIEQPHGLKIEFDRAVTGFCAKNYPKLSLWNMVQSDTLKTAGEKRRDFTVNEYPGYIPPDLRDFYVYESDKGHCLRIIPSNMEAEAEFSHIDQVLEAAPVKTVLRCGFRWLKGYPVAPIPFIPGYGLAIPPDDREF